MLQPNRSVSAERLIELLWGDEPPETADNAIQVHVSHLRNVLAPRQRDAPTVLTKSGDGYALSVEPHQLDLQRFEHLASVGRQALSEGDTQDAARLLREALALWRGPALADVEAPFAVAERHQLEELRLAALEERIEADLALGQHSDLVPELQGLVAQHPLRERLAGHLMLALYRCGRQAESSVVFHRVREALDESQGMEPGRGVFSNS